MPTALFISPHLDDVAFSCGGTLRRLSDAGWQTVLWTVFTASVSAPQGFALRCQTDKGIPPETDYLALRRAEDLAFATTARVTECRHGPFREAPHRGYESPADLFAGTNPEDDVLQPIQDALATLDRTFRPDLIFAPQGLGNHVDHLQVIRAVLGVYPARQVAWYRDTPYAIREPDARPAPPLEEADLPLARVPLSADDLAHKIAGCVLYASQIGFQFGGADAVGSKLTAFHQRESGPARQPGFAECFLVHSSQHPHLPT